MLRINILIVAFLMIPGSFSLYNEKFRPQVHFSSTENWINDPNGLVFDPNSGFYHLFFQYNPNDTIAANIHWGHAISTDLVHWEHLPTAIYPKDGNLIYSGSAIIDKNNVTGLQIHQNMPTLIAIFTAHDQITSVQKQWIAYSNNGPKYTQFKFYKKNPVIPNPNPSVQKNFRDPGVFKYKDHYVAVLAAGESILIYNSNDLLEWKLVSEFKANLHGRVRECPSLFPINTNINGVEVEKWVLTMSLSDYTNEAGEIFPNEQYYIGTFDGKKFTYEHPDHIELWVDVGPDCYAGIVFNQMLNDRIVIISWMNRWAYASNLDFNVWNGQMTIPRQFTLKNVGNQTLLSSLPVQEVETLRIKPFKFENVLIENDFIYKFEMDDSEKTKHLLDIEMCLDLSNLTSSDSFDFVFSGMKNNLNISFKENEFTLDRSNAGRNDLPNFARTWKAYRLIDEKILKLRIFIDRCSIELFVDDGLVSMTALFFSDEDLASTLTLQIHSAEEKTNILVKQLDIYQLKSTWKRYDTQQ